MEPPRQDDQKLNPPPFATDPQYSRMLCRADLSKRIDQIMELSSKKPSEREEVHVNTLLAELVDELQSIQLNSMQPETPRTEKHRTSANIQNVRKKRLFLITASDGYFLDCAAA